MYTQANIEKRWDVQRRLWLKCCSPAIYAKVNEVSLDQAKKMIAEQEDVRGDIPSQELPEDEFDPERKFFKKVLKQQKGPYPLFGAYYPLEEVIEAYVDIWENGDESDEGDKS